MSGGDAYEDEMAFLRGHDDTEPAAFAGALRAALVPPEAPNARRLVPMLAETARASAAEASTRRIRAPRRRIAIAARIAFAVALLPVLSAGLAVAGVKLPEPAQSAFERVGIELPNQADESASEEAVPGGSGESSAGGAQDEPAGPGAGGRENAAGKRGHGKDKGNPARQHGREVGAQGNGRGLGKRGVAPGQSNPNRGGGDGGGGGGGKAVGKTGATPPGRAGKPVAPGQAGGSAVADEKGGGKPG